eukprot:4087424-Pyramimonas_sp.AAC.1
MSPRLRAGSARRGATDPPWERGGGLPAGSLARRGRLETGALAREAACAGDVLKRMMLQPALAL